MLRVFFSTYDSKTPYKLGQFSVTFNDSIFLSYAIGKVYYHCFAFGLLRHGTISGDEGVSLSQGAFEASKFITKIAAPFVIIVPTLSIVAVIAN